ncbi:MAG: class I SAM-dependent methyltransferase [Candidatus Aenigmarchaeota archaeon]|nr:class I SAM-dependent methyltransferase [Candidatus Aenigmarchaeota archaeon]
MKERKNRVCPVERAGSLDSRIRKLYQNPEKMLRKYVRSGMTVLDLGCGPGFFSTAMAEMVGESGLVIAADLQQGMLSKLKEKIKGTGIEKTILLHKTSENRIGISRHVDLVLAFYIIHEIPDQERAMKEIWSILKPNGIFYLVEPKYFHVSKGEFEESVNKALKLGFSVVERPRIFLGRAAVLKK